MRVTGDMEKVTDVLIHNIPRNRRTKGAMVVMGHGTSHPASAFYRPWKGVRQLTM